MSIDPDLSAENLQIRPGFEDAVQLDLRAGSDDLYFFFGGIAGNLAMPPYEFYKSSGVLDCQKVFIRDLSQSWYHGAPGLPSIRDTQVLISEIIDHVQPSNIVFVGNSMGGFAAILFACLLKRGRVIAFSPQTFVSPWLKFKYRDFRWKSQSLRVWRRGFVTQRYWDLRPIVNAAPGQITIDVHAAGDDRLDVAHAQRIAMDDKVRLHVHRQGAHQLVKSLRDAGQLAGIFDA
ncbi:MAG: hypothetical protein AAGJ29_08190 [Pseudomonadota bacterium]